MSQPLTQAKRDARAHAIYEKMTRHSSRLGYFVLFIISYAVVRLSQRFAFDLDGFWYSFWSVLIFVCCMTAPPVLLHLFAKRAVRNAGWPHETRCETEAVRRTTTNVAGSCVENSREEDLAARVIWGVMCCGAGGFLWLKSSEAQSQTLAISYGAGVALCVTALIWHLFNSHLPTLRVDDRGIFGYAYILFPRLFRWENIREVHFVRCYDPLKDKKYVIVRLKAADGKELLRFKLEAERKEEQERASQFVEQIKLRL